MAETPSTPGPREYEDRLVRRVQAEADSCTLCLYAIKGARAEGNAVAARQAREVLVARASDLLDLAKKLTPDAGL